MEEAVIVAACRSAVGKAGRGSLRDTRPDELAAAAIQEIMKRVPAVQGSDIEDVILGCAMPEREQGFNIARIAVMRAGLPHSVPAVTVNRFCSSGLQTIAMAAERIMCGHADVIIAGGVESMSYIPFDAKMRMAPNPVLASEHPDSYLGMGLTAENVVRDYKVTREEMDQFAFDSHQKALAAIADGKFKDEIFPLTVSTERVLPDGSIECKEFVFDQDEGPRADSTIAKLNTLRAVFKMGGTVTAGNSSQVSDGAAMVMVMSRTRADALGLKPMAIFKGFAVAGVAPEVMGIGPIEAIPKLLERSGKSMADIDLFELNEAFAAQSLAVIKELDMPMDKVNVNGGAIALGHPLGCSGSKLTVSLIHELQRRGGGTGVVSMCIGGGMGAAGMFEVLA